MNDDDLLRFEAVRASHGGAPVLDGLELRVPRGAVYALLGRNGAGKTTAVRCALGLDRPDTGRVRLFGRDPWRERCRALARVGYVPEEPDAPPALSPAQLGRLAARLAARWDGAAYDARLARGDVPRDVPFGRLSRGQKAQVGLALALAPRPELLILDDPTLGLDHVARRAFYEELVGELAERGVTVLITTHDIAAVERIASHVGVLGGGRLVLDMELEALKAGFRRVRVGDGRAPLDAGRPLHVESGLWGVEAILADYQETDFVRWLRRSGALEVEMAPMSLEEIFVAVTRNPGSAP